MKSLSALGRTATFSALLLSSRFLYSQTPPLPATPAPVVSGQAWSFTVSGDSRNCGDVVMPAIAQGASRANAQFYWHLGDLRLTSDIDEDIKKLLKHEEGDLEMSTYLGDADGHRIGEWDDFKKKQIAVFGKIPFFLGIGNHETKPPQSRDRFAKYFVEELNIPELKQQRARDSRKHSVLDPGPKTYFHWTMGNVDLIYLDNASREQFDDAEMKWFKQVLEDDANSPITTVVVGMHEALPYSISAGHSMNESPDGVRTGIEVYQALLTLQNEKKKKVYVLASHSHFFMDGTFKTRYWNAHGGVLPGWIVGTAGAVRYRLPQEAGMANSAKTNVYGYLLGTVSPDGSIKFDFQQLEEKDIPQNVKDRYPQDFVHWCFTENKN